MADVFTSYSRNDERVAKKVVELLQVMGFTVDWDDNFQIAVGATLTSLLDSRCNEAICVLVLWSQSAIESKWVQTEARIGMERGRLLQVTLDGTRPPLVYRDYIYGSLEKWDGTKTHQEFQRIVKGIRFFQERVKK